MHQDHDWIGLCKAWILNVLAFLFSFTGVEWALKISVLFVTLAYTCWKFYEDYKKSRK